MCFYSAGLETLCQLTLHAKPVSVLDWNKNGKKFASGSDDGEIAIWKLNDDEKNNNNDNDIKLFGVDNSFKNKESWLLVHKVR